MVVFDAGFLMALFNRKAKLSVPDGRARVAYLFAELDKAREVIVVPTPALSEFLVRAEAAGPDYLRIMGNSARFRIAAFDTLAAVEAADDLNHALARGDKRGGVEKSASWQKIKFDRQIIAIARVTMSSIIYSDDPDFKTLVGERGPQVIDFADLTLPPEDAQMEIRFDTPADDEGQDG